MRTQWGGAVCSANLRSYLESTWVAPYSTSNPPSADNIKSVTIADGADLSPALTTSQVTVSDSTFLQGLGQ